MRGWWAVVALAGAGCAPEVDPQVVVTLDAEAGARARTRWLRVEVATAAGEAVYDAAFDVDADDAEVRFPARIPLTARDGDASRGYRLTATLWDTEERPATTGRPFATVRAVGRYRDGSVGDVRLRFDDDCVQVEDCGEGRTCVAGFCRGACFEDGADEPACSACELCDRGACKRVPDGSACGCRGDECRGGECVVAYGALELSAGVNHTCAYLAGALDLACWGSNAEGQLGTETPGAHAAAPVRVSTWIRRASAGGSVESWTGDPEDPVRVAHAFTCGIDARDGSVLCWGANGSGEAGQPDAATVPTPTAVSALTATRVAAGGYHACAWDGDGNLACWGSNAEGQLGAGTTGLDPVPVPVGVSAPAGVSGWLDVCGGRFFSCALAEGETRRVFCWGGNYSGELGADPAGLPSSATPLEVDLPNSAWTAVACGAFHACALDDSGEIWCWGGNAFGNLGRGTSGEPSLPDPARVATDARFRSMSCGRSHCCAATADAALDARRLYCWGRNDFGQLGLGTVGEPVSTPTEVPGGLGWRETDLGELHSCAARESGALYCWGGSADGQVGIGDTVTHARPMRVCLEGT